jgi:hypothetical protein
VSVLDDSKIADAVANYISRNAESLQAHNILLYDNRGALAVRDPLSKRVAWVAAFGTDGCVKDERVSKYVNEILTDLQGNYTRFCFCDCYGVWYILVPVKHRDNYRNVLQTVGAFVHSRSAAASGVPFTLVRDWEHLFKSSGVTPIDIAEELYS